MIFFTTFPLGVFLTVTVRRLGVAWAKRTEGGQKVREDATRAHLQRFPKILALGLGVEGPRRERYPSKNLTTLPSLNLFPFLDPEQDRCGTSVWALGCSG